MTLPSRKTKMDADEGFLERSRSFYETLLGVPPTKLRPGFVKFEPQDPSVNLTLNEVSKVANTGGTATHYGVQVKTPQVVKDAAARLTDAGLDTAIQDNTTCCYAVQDKVWAADPEGNRWEIFVVLDTDTDQRKDDESGCCATNTKQPTANTCC